MPEQSRHEESPHTHQSIEGLPTEPTHLKEGEASSMHQCSETLRLSVPHAYKPVTNCDPRHLGDYEDVGLSALSHDMQHAVTSLFSQFPGIPPRLLARVIHESVDRHTGRWDEAEQEQQSILASTGNASLYDQVEVIEAINDGSGNSGNVAIALIVDCFGATVTLEAKGDYIEFTRKQVVALAAVLTRAAGDLEAVEA